MHILFTPLPIFDLKLRFHWKKKYFFRILETVDKYQHPKSKINKTEYVQTSKPRAEIKQQKSVDTDCNEIQ